MGFFEELDRMSGATGAAQAQSAPEGRPRWTVLALPTAVIAVLLIPGILAVMDAGVGATIVASVLGLVATAAGYVAGRAG